MHRPLTKTEIDKEFKIASKHIRQANKGLPWPVKINKDWILNLRDNCLTMQITYLDGDLRDQVYNIAIL